jgi:hypothetical protein
MNKQTEEALLELHFFINEELETAYRCDTNKAVKLKAKLDSIEEKINACKEALSEQEIRCQYADDVGMSEYKCASKCQYEQPAQEPAQEPVGVVRAMDGEWFGYLYTPQLENVEAGDKLYTHPKQLKRLSEGELRKISNYCFFKQKNYGKAILNALAIKNGMELSDE